MRVGVISDTHGLLRPEAIAALVGSDLILHAGDVGDPEILQSLRELAPIRAVRGNVDRGAWAKELPKTEVVEVGGVVLYMLHNRDELELDPGAAEFAAVISGHSHKPSTEQQQGVLFLNPGAAGPKRFSLPVSVATLRVEKGRLEAELIELTV